MRKRLEIFARLLIGALVIGGAVILMTQEYENARAYYQTKCQEEMAKVLAGHQNQNRPSADECQNAEEYMPWRYILIAWPTGITTWAIIVTLVVVGWQSWETRKSASAALEQIQLIKEKERARIVVTVLRPDQINFGFIGNRIDIHIKNTGFSQAQNVTSEGKASVEVKGFDPAIGPDIEDLALPSVMRPEEAPVETWVWFSIPEEWSEEIGIANPSITIRVRGTVQYEDIFGDRHATPFKLVLTHPRTRKWIGNDAAETHPFSRWHEDGQEENRAT